MAKDKFEMGKFKKFVYSNFWGEYAVSRLHCIESVIIPRLICDEKAIKKYYKKKTGKELDLNNPKTLSEKMNWYKLYGKKRLMQKCADKAAVRKYVSRCGYEDILNENYGIYKRAKDIPLNELPDQFVIKATHGSHMNIIVRDKSEINWRHARLMMESWLDQDIYWSGREWVYKKIPRRLIVEKYLEDETGELRDYKFFCFNGKPCYLQFDTGRYTGKHVRNYYDMDLNMLPIRDDVASDSSVELGLPEEKIIEMREIARDLCKPFQFVRVDFYCINGKVYFGEMTFFHNGGITWFDPEEYDLIFGNNWTIQP